MFDAEASEEGRKNGGDSSMSTSTESAHTPSVLQTSRQDCSSDTHRTDTAITHPLDVTAVVSHASDSHQSMELDKCGDVQTPDDESPSPGKASNTTPSKGNISIPAIIITSRYSRWGESSKCLIYMKYRIIILIITITVVPATAGPLGERPPALAGHFCDVPTTLPC